MDVDGKFLGKDRPPVGRFAPASTRLVGLPGKVRTIRRGRKRQLAKVQFKPDDRTLADGPGATMFREAEIAGKPVLRTLERSGIAKQPPPGCWNRGQPIAIAARGRVTSDLFPFAIDKSFDNHGLGA